MADFTIKTYLAGFVIFIFIITAGVAMMSEYNAADNTFANSTDLKYFNSTFNKFQDISSQSQNLKGNIETITPEAGIFGVLSSLIGGAWNFVSLIFSNFAFITTALNGLEIIFGIPGWIPALIGMIITIFIGFAIYSAVFQREL